jgi:mannose-6-phosphate isomerase
MRCIPVYKQTLWGGNKLKTVLGKEYDGETMAESWELSCHEDGMSSIANGVHAGKRVFDVLAEHPEYSGDSVGPGEAFPLLVKFIDANDDLSIQVHPTKQTANEARGEQSKTEIWVVMEAEPGATLYCGFCRDVTPDELIARARDGSILETLNRVPVKRGDVFHIYAGTVHAIGKGLLIAEIQQSANTTFRVYDFMRRGKDGNLRELHIEAAARAASLAGSLSCAADQRVIKQNEAFIHSMLFDSEMFVTERYDILFKAALESTRASFDALLFVEGQASVVYRGERYAAKKGDCYFIPAGMGEYEITGRCCVLRNRVLRNKERDRK